MSTPTPCTQRPDYWLQQSDSPNWGTTPAAEYAKLQCETVCTNYVQCAKDALEAGTTLPRSFWRSSDNAYQDPERPRIASGGIWAGIACNGDQPTFEALSKIATPGVIPLPIFPVAAEDDPDVCSGCKRGLVGRHEVAGPNTAKRAVRKPRPLCVGCYSKVKRSGELLTTPRAEVPDNCVTCDRKMRRRSDTPDPFTVVHEAHGVCATCARAAERAAA